MIQVSTCFLLFNPINIVFYFDEKMSDERINLNPRQKKHARAGRKIERYGWHHGACVSYQITHFKKINRKLRKK